MTLYKRRDKFSSLSARTGTIFSRLPLSPNQWTALSLVPAVLGLYAAYYGNMMLAAAFFGLTAFFDIIDGAVARATGRSTKLGAYFDTVVDRYIEFVLIAPLLFLGLPQLYMPAYSWILLLLFGSMMSTYAKSASAEKGIAKEKGGHGIKGGILEHPDRMILLFLVFAVASLADKSYAAYMVAALAVLTNVSAVQRAWYAYKTVKTNVGSK